MSKLIFNTKEKILAKALEMFNKNGIEYVGLRELASLLEIRVSNITYYFPTKDDLVNQLSIELRELNSKIVIKNENLTLLSFLNMLQQVFHNHVKYRCLLWSFVHLLDNNKILSLNYKNTQRNRNKTLQSNIDTLLQSGYLKLETNEEVDFLVCNLSLIIRFWISEAKISLSHLNNEQQINHYILLITKLLNPIATAKGKKEIQKFISNKSPNCIP